MTTALIDRFMGNDAAADLGPREQIAVFDYDPETDDGGIWLATLPLSVIYEHGATDCRMTYDLYAARKAGAIVFAVLGALAMGVLSYLTLGGAAGAVVGLLMGSMLGATGGWITGHRFAPKPISLYRRVWTLASEEELGLAKGEEPVPGHTRTPAGELVRQTETGYWRQEVYPLRYTNIRGEEAVDDPVVVGQGCCGGPLRSGDDPGHYPVGGYAAADRQITVGAASHEYLGTHTGGDRGGPGRRRGGPGGVPDHLDQ